MDHLNTFDLQLFADPPADGGDGGAPAPDPGTPGGDDGTGDSGSQTGNTILGGAGNNDQAQGGNNSGNNAAPPAGAPESYDFSNIVPEGMEYDEVSARAFGEVARKAGLSQEQASAVATYGMQYMRQGVEAAQTAFNQQVEDWGVQAQRELGGAFEETKAKAAVAMNRFEQQIPGLRQMFGETGAGNRIEMIRLMAAVGDLVGEDGGHGDNGNGHEPSIYNNTDFSLYKS